MATFGQIVTVSVTKASVSITQQGFGTPMVLAYDAPVGVTGFYAVYTSKEAMVTDGWSTSHPAYAKVNAIFTQDPSVVNVVVGIGSNDPTRLLELVPIVQDSHDYTITINGTEFEITSGVGATQKEIVDAMTVEIQAGAEPVTASDDDSTLSLTADAAGAWYSALMVDGDWSTIVDATVDAGVTADLTAIKAATDNGDQDWYAMAAVYQSDAILGAINTWIASYPLLFGFESEEATVVANPATGICKTLSDAASTSAIPFYYEAEPKELAHGESHLAAGAIGRLLPKDAGSATWMFKTVTGRLPNVLTDTEKSRLAAQNCNWYETVAGHPGINGGTMAAGGGGTVSSGEYIDIVQALHWLEARLGEAIFGKMAAVDKVPFTADGQAMLDQVIGGVLELAVEKGIMVAGSYTITIPDPEDISDANKELRKWTGITFAGTLQGAVHRVPMTGTVTL